MKIKASKRVFMGKKTHSLRREGLITGSIFGPATETVPVQLDLKDFTKLESDIGHTSFFDIDLEGKKYSVIIKDVQKHPVTGIFLNVDLYMPSQSTKMQVEVPFEFVGESPAVKNNLGFMLNTADSVVVHCLPKDLPQSISVDVSSLVDLSSTISFKDVVLPEGVEYDSSVDLEMTFVMIETAQKADAEPVVEADVEATEDPAAPSTEPQE